MVMHFEGVCCGTPYFAPHVLTPSIAFTMDFNVGDKVFYTRSNGVATVVGFAPTTNGLFTWSIFKMESRW